MKKSSSITYKLIFFLIIIYIFSSSLLFLFINNIMKSIIDKNQEKVYMEKIESILNIISRKYKLLLDTQMIETYEDDFKNSTLKLLKQMYYSEKNPSIYPMIFKNNGDIVLHPILKRGNASLKNNTFVKTIIKNSVTNLNYLYNNQKKWGYFKTFNKWNWKIGYVIPLNIKYKELTSFRKRFIILMIIIALLTISIMILIIFRVIKPITILTKASIAMENGKLDYPIAIKSSDEIGILSKSFKTMRDSIKYQISDLANKNMELTKNKEELIKANFEAQCANKAKDEFLAIMSHELRTPLNSIIGFSSHLKNKDSNLNEKQSKYLKKINKNGKSLLNIINNILSITKIESGKHELSIEKVNIEKMIKSIIENFTIDASLNEISIMFNNSENIRFIRSDYQKLLNIINNLISNAIKFNVKGGFINISLFYEDKNRIKMIFQDSGIGISDKKKEMIFNPFTQADSSYSRKYSGTGLGLSIVKKYIDFLKGEITIKSEINKGSKFIITIPHNLQ